ncbi:DUF2798 domain-containing protein [Acetobacterium tundrae]|uniref:DUF2798 domain-containing protein n=1 Tax=Acetobacterium tundrae TaxID=132932 RepID=A0ABR6WMA9_9FIRM|nr:DUF2798 domain-containing protein [Acetobacterium tundrae]MBC3797615.1 DUF2798 domain-containing protein [Acetobacterium tundrae]
MIHQKYFGLVAGFFFSFIVSLVLAFVMTFATTGGISLMPVVMTFIEAFVISYLAALIIPVNKIGGGFATRFKAEPETMKFNLLSNIPITLILVLILSFSLTAINVGFVSMFLMAWLSTIPVSMVAVYVVSVIITPMVGKMTNACIKN